MTFLNIAMLGGIFAFNIPVIIHLFNRSRFKVVKWGAMHLLEPAIRKNMRRIRLEQVLLMMLRAMIPVALALAMAAPVLTAGTPLIGSAPSSTVLLMDTSFSMQAVPGGAAGGRSNFERAQDESIELVRGLPSGSQVGALEIAERANPLTDRPTTDRRRVEHRLEQAQAGAGAVDMAAALEKSVETIASMRHHAKRDIVLVTDMQRTSWPEQQRDRLMRIRQKLAELQPRPTLTLMHVGEPVEENVAVTEVRTVPRHIVAGREVRIEATVHNFGNRAHRNVRADVYVNGSVRGRISYDMIEPGGSATSSADLTLRFDPDEAGSHYIEVRIDTDPIEADNRLLHQLEVLDHIPVLVVAGGGRQSGGGAGDDVVDALQPYAAVDPADTRDLFKVTLINERELGEHELTPYAVVVLADAARLSQAAIERLETFVNDGGGLLIFPGERVAGEGRHWYEGPLYRSGRGLLPAPILGIGDAGGEAQDGGQRRPVHVARQSFDHEALRLFNDPQQEDLSGLRFVRWFRYHPQPPSAAGQRVSVMARFSNGDPFLMEKTYGAGRVIAAAGPAEVGWGYMPLRAHVFVPLMQQLAKVPALEAQPQRNLRVGEPIVELFEREWIGESVDLAFAPLGQTEPADRYSLPVRDRRGRGVAEFSATWKPGLYTLTRPDGTEAHFTVNVSRTQSDLEQLDQRQVAELAEMLDARVVRSARTFLDEAEQQRHGRDIWPWFLMAAIVFLIAEMLLQQLLTRRRS